MDWQFLSTHDHAARGFTTALLPIGTLEAHGPAPVGTDNLIPLALCRRLAAELEIPTLPVMPYGITSSLLAYPGGCSLTPEVLAGFLDALGRSLHRNGLRELLIVNGHGGNTDTLRNAAARLFATIGLHVAVLDWWPETQDAAEELFGAGGLGHAAIDELAALVGLWPDEFGARLSGGSVPAFCYPKGLSVYPAPRSTLTYDHRSTEVDLGRLSPEKCAQFADRVTAALAGILRDVLAGWRAIGR